MKRQDFLKLLSLSTFGLAATSCDGKQASAVTEGPIMISTWADGLNTNKEGWAVLDKNGTAMDAIEAGAVWIESQTNCCVGLGGNPDRDGIVTLDACVMDHAYNCGGVAALERIKHPLSVARLVMEKTPHVLLAGDGAQQFALEQGHSLENGALSDEADKTYKHWLEEQKYKPVINIENSVPKKLPNGDFNHDTMAMLTLDREGKLAGGVTTSGMGFKMRGRVGDSPIIGAGLYVDGEVGAATSSGVGEEVIRNVGSHLVVELMRQGRTPEQACKEAVMRIINRKANGAKDLQVGFVALALDGSYGAYSIQAGFQYAVKSETEEVLLDAESYYF